MTRSLASVLLLALAPAALPAVFCVDGGEAFEKALLAAEANGQDDEIRLAAGVFVATGVFFDYRSDEGSSLVISGGWQHAGPVACASRLEDPGLTVLDGEGQRPVLFLFETGEGAITVENLTIANGFSGTGASGGLQLGGGVGGVFDATVERVIVRGNHSTGFRAALNVVSNGRLRLAGNLVVDNTCEQGSCGISTLSNLVTDRDEPTVAVVNNTVARNRCDGDCFVAGLRLSGAATALIANNLVFGNQDRDVDLIVPGTATGNAWQTVVRLRVPVATGNLAVGATEVVDSEAGDDRLRPGSLLVDAGVALPPGLEPALSLDGGPRLNGPALDIGAYESQRFVFGDGFEG